MSQVRLSEELTKRLRLRAVVEDKTLPGLCEELLELGLGASSSEPGRFVAGLASDGGAPSVCGDDEMVAASQAGVVLGVDTCARSMGAPLLCKECLSERHKASCSKFRRAS